MKEDYEILSRYLIKKKLTYSEFNELIGNYFVNNYEELEDNLFLIEIMDALEGNCKTYTDYVEIID